MEQPFLPLKVSGTCVRDDDTLFRNIDLAMARGYPEVVARLPAREDVILMVASGPRVQSQLEIIRQQWQCGMPVVAVRGAHDWLIDNGILPTYAVSVDPLEESWTCFSKKTPRVHYAIASQCPPSMFDHLEGCPITIWHLHMKAGQRRPAGRILVGGGTTSGLRAISLFYVLGWRKFALFGFDSCLDGKILRINGTGAKPEDDISPIRIEPNGEDYFCNPAMALQASQFQDFYYGLPDIEFYPFGDGLIPAIIRKRQETAMQLAAAMEIPAEPNGRVSFIHAGDEMAASFRYRAAIPARELGASLNDLTASTLIFTKPQPGEHYAIALAKARGAWTVADFCDDHFGWLHYDECLRLADAVTCPTEAMAARIRALGREATVIPDPYEYPFEAPHYSGTRLLWFGHEVNRASIERIRPDLTEYPLQIVSNYGGHTPWSKETMLKEFAIADIVVLPATEATKSANRAVEAIRQGCFVVAEPHPALMDIPGIWIGTIKEGIAWSKLHPNEVNARISSAQSYVTEKYSPRTCGQMWKNAIQRPTTSAVAESIGRVGSMSI